MKVRPIVIALGFVCSFVLGWSLPLPPPFQNPPLPPSPTLARSVIDGHVIEHDPSAVLEFESYGTRSSTEGASTLDRETAATSGGLSTSSEEVASNFQTSAPTDGLGASGGSVLASITAKSGDSLSLMVAGIIICLLGIFLLFKPIPGMGALIGGGPGLGLSVIALGAGLIAVGWLKDEYPWAIWFVLLIAAGAALLLLRQSTALHRTAPDLAAKRTALTNIVSGVASLSATDPATFDKVKSSIKLVSGADNDLVKKEVFKVQNPTPP